MLEKTFENRIVLITGSSRGLGAQMALGLAERGAAVIVNYLRDQAAAHDVVEQIEKNGGVALALQGDVREWDQVQRLFARAEEWRGRMDVLINNVGEFTTGPLTELSVEEWQNMLASNLTSCFYCCKAAIPGMRQNGGGRIINVALANADRVHAYREAAAHAIAKTGVLILTRSLAAEVAPWGITVNAVSPGFMEKPSQPSMIEEMPRKIPMGRLGRAQDLVAAIAYLASDEAEYVTGSNIIVSGGWGL